MFRKVPTKQVNNLAKFKNLTSSRTNPHSYKVLPSNAGEMIGNSILVTTASVKRCCFSTSTANLSSNSSGGDDSSTITYVNGSKKAPRAIGPYSQGVKANGNFYVSGCLGIDGETGEMVGEDVVQQARQALANLKYVLEEGGCTLKDVVKTTVLLTDINDFQAVNEVYSEYFSGDNKPARVCYAASGLPKKARVEIEAIAVYKE